MNKEMYDKIVDVERLGEEKINEVYNELFNKYKSDYKKIAELMNVLNDRLEKNLNDKELRKVYILITSAISGRANENLNVDKYSEFCNLTNEYSIEKISSKEETI